MAARRKKERRGKRKEREGWNCFLRRRFKKGERRGRKVNWRTERGIFVLAACQRKGRERKKRGEGSSERSENLRGG